MTFMMTFEEMLEKCIQNKDKVEKYSKFLTVVMIVIIVLLAYFNIYNTRTHIDEQSATITKGVLLFFYFTMVFNWHYTDCRKDRIYSKFPAILGASIIGILGLYLALKTTFFSERFLVDIIVTFGLYSLFISFSIFLIHCLSIRILDYTIFANPTLKYTAKVIKLEHVTQRSKNHTSHFYYAYFYDYTNRRIKGQISEKEYTYWEERDVISTVLQQHIDGVKVKSIRRLHNFQGLTDMEIDRQNHLRDVELFGQSQEEMDLASGTTKRLSYKWPFIIVGVLMLLPYTVIHEEFEELMSCSIPLCAALILISIALTSGVSYLEYKKLRDKYTIEDIKLWADCLLHRILIYSLSTFALVGFCLTFYNNCKQDKQKNEQCTVLKVHKIDDNMLHFSDYILYVKRPNGHTQKMNFRYNKDEIHEIGENVEIKFNRGAFGYDLTETRY